MPYSSIVLEMLMHSIERHADYGQFIILGVSVLLLITYVIVKIFSPKSYNHLFFVTFNREGARFVFSDTSLAVKQADSFLLVASVVSISGSIYASYRYYPHNTIILSDPQTILVFLVIIVAVVSILFLKILIYNYFAWLFDMQEQMTVYLNSFFHSISLLGLLVFPIFTLIPFVGGILLNVLIYLIILLAGLWFIYNTIRFFRQSFKIKFFNHYSILYFCIFEILPIIVSIRLLGNL